jgi:hypothetical protein
MLSDWAYSSASLIRRPTKSPARRRDRSAQSCELQCAVTALRDALLRGESDPTHQINNEKNDQNRAEYSAADLHVTLR